MHSHLRDTTLVPPPPLSERQRLVICGAALLVAASRFWALSRSMWEWDEGLFALAVRDYDVTDHRPHPPGFPLYIGAAKLLRLLIASDFRALQTVTLVGALLLFPVLFLLARELRLSFSTSLLGALLYAFAPNVWYYGGTAFSDIPATTAIIAANALLLRGCRDGRSYLAGALVFGVSLGLRPQLLLAGVVTLSLATFFQWRTSRSRVITALMIILAVVAASYFGAAVASSSVEGYFESLIGQSGYVRAVDSFFNPSRPALHDLVVHFFIKAVRGARKVAFVIAVLAMIAVAFSIPRRATNIWFLILIFAPLNLLSWLMLDIGAASRYAVAYAPMYTLLAAEGARNLTERLRDTRARATAQAVLILFLTVHMIVWAAPGIREVRSKVSPPAAAMEWLLENAPPTARIYMHEGLEPLAKHYLTAYDVLYVRPMQPLPGVTFERPHYYVIDELSRQPGAQNFAYHDRPLFQFARSRYFAASVLPLAALVRFDDGWFEREVTGTAAWQWMGPRGVLALSPIEGPASLVLEFRVPAEVAAKKAIVTVTVNGEIVARHRAVEGPNRISAMVSSLGDRPNSAVITIDQTFTPSNDPRELGLQLSSWSWSPAPRRADTP